MVSTFNTSDVPPAERAGYWREFVIKDLAKHEFASGVGQDFHASMSVGWLGTVGVFQFECDPCVLERSPRNLATCASDDFIFTVQMEGNTELAQGDRFLEMGDGSLALLDTARPMTVVHHAKLRCITVTIPRRALEQRMGNAAALTAFAISADKPVAGLTYEFVQMLPARMDELPDHSRLQIGEQVVDLIALTLAQDLDDSQAALSAPRAMTLLRLKSIIEARLSDFDLKPATAAAAAGVSVRYANALLAEEGYSIEKYILHRRLERCRRALEDPRQANRLIGEIAFGWGFSDISHFGRRFRAAFGCAPGDYRRRQLQEARGIATA